MLKTDSLREAMTRSCRWCQANPEKFTIFVESGNIETTGERQRHENGHFADIRQRDTGYARRGMHKPSENSDA